MNDFLNHGCKLPPEQQAIRDRCFHPSGTFVEFPMEDVETSIPARFEKIVKRYPDNTAIITDERVVTYAELNGIANRVSRIVMAQGGNNAMPIALLFDKGIEQIAAMIGVLKTGRFFVLLDSSSPKARFDVILEDCLPDLAITDRKNMSLAKDLMRNNQPVIEIDSVDDYIPIDNLGREISCDTLAFIIHTSGSTGRPKGVIHHHQMVLHHLMLRSNADGLCPQDRIPHLTSGTSHAIIASLGALLNGAALLLFDVNKKGVAGLSYWLAHKKATILPIAAPLFRKLCEFLTEPDRFPDIRLVRLSSETVCKADVDLYKRYFSTYSLLVNGVNSTETHMLAEYIIDRDSQLPGDDVPVGYAVRDKEILLLDEWGDPVSCNEIGEIVVRSKYLSPGYWRNPELTAVKFKSDPIDSEKRLYYSGDLGIMLPDGCLIHKGRKDFRVKIRGYRVELGEVERVLQCHPAVNQTVVVAREDRSGESRLIAYYTSPEARSLSVSALRTFILEKLPEYMMPSSFVRLDSLPLMTNGKIDREALPEPDNRRPELDTLFIAPRTDLEKAVAQIFSECTGIEQVGVKDNFVDLGGDSLLLARLVSRLSVTFQREFLVGELYECSSVAGIARLLEKPTLSPPPKVQVTRSAATDNIPNLLSFAQKRLWFLDQLNPGDPVYNLLLAFQITGELNITALEQSVNEIIARHEVLRTVFDSVDGEPRARVLSSSPIALNVHDLGKSKSAIEVELQCHCAALAQEPFDLSRGLLLRASLLRRGSADHVLLLVVHHIVFDGWSVGVFWSELSACYEALSRGGKTSLPELAVQYADYAHWQSESFQNQVLQEQLDYWRRQLAGSAPLQLLTDRSRPPIQTSHGAKRCFTLSMDLSAKLKRLGHDCGATLFMTLTAAFQTLLHRYTGQHDIAIGCPVAGRNRSEAEKLIGFFLNTLVFRVDTSGEPSFLELLDRVRKVSLAAYAHQDLPFEKLVEELHPERHLNRNPIVDVMFAFQNTPHVSPNLCGASVFQLDIDSGISRFDLQLFMEESSDQLRGNFSYNTDLFHATTIDRMAEHFINLLESIAADPYQSIGQITLLSTPERQQIEAWNDTERDYSSDKCIHELFEKQVEKTPDAIALVFEDQQLTYRELNNRANQLGYYLRKLGVGPEVLVGVCVERSVEMIVGLLGILKCGGAYVPLDPAYPKERLQFMLEDSQTPLILTQRRLVQVLPDHRAQVVCLEGTWDHVSQQSGEDPLQQTRGETAAYMIYTSGSTGTPKGVINVHSGLSNRLQWMQESYQLTAADRVLQKTPFTFDVSVWEFFWPLISGATLVIARPEGHRDSAYLLKLIQSKQITTMHFVPAMLGAFLQEAGVENCPSLKRVFCSGEALSYELQQLFFERMGTALHNLYGPTEASIDVTAWECSRDRDRAIVPIGRPIANTQVFILDQYLAPVPIGVVGEMYIGGLGLARGYLNRPELTAEKFIYHSFNGEPAKRLYKTGDLARYLADGNIEFVGRMDDQVKIRGYRIELGEIEAVLGQHPMVQSSVAVVREEEPGDKRLVGYVVVRPGEAFDASEVRKYLKHKLPEYMIPAALVRLDELPLTPSGKVDRQALPAPDQNRPELDSVYQTPRTPTEERLATIWGEVLKLEKFGIYDNFFNLGGHSLLATQVMSRMRNAFSIDLPLRRMFESPTVAEMADVITQSQCKQASNAELAQLLGEAELMTEAEVQTRLAGARARRSEKNGHE